MLKGQNANMKLPTVKTIFKIVLVAAYIGLVFLPLVQMINASFMIEGGRVPNSTPEFTLINYFHVFSSPTLVSAIWNSIFYVLLNIMITIPIAFPAAYAFSRYSFVGDKHLFLTFLAFRVTPPVVLTLPIFKLFSILGLVNSPLGIALSHCLFTLPVSIWILEGFINAVPKELDENAFIDGYSMSKFHYQILLPIIAPGIGVAAFFCFLFSWVEVVFARILTITNGKPITMAINSLFGFNTDMGLVAAMIVVSVIPGVILFYFIRNHISKGFAIGH